MGDSTSAGEVAVVGAGIVGLATAHALAVEGHDVTVYERGVPGNGQSAGQSRLFRHGHDDPRLVELTRESRAIWAEWEERFGTELVSRDGVLALGEGALERLRRMEEAGGIEAREVGPDEALERLPLLARAPTPAVLDAGGGSIRTQAAIAALAGELEGALESAEVISVRPTEGGAAEVRTGTGRAEFDRAVVCAGRGGPALARGAGVSLPIDLSAHVRLTFAVRGEAPATVACLQDSTGEFGETGIYAAPLPGNEAYAVGLGETTPAGEDGAVADPAQLAELAERTAGYVERALPGLDPRPREHVHCHVTEAPWSEDGFGVWEAGPILFAAGHNLFKQAPGLGRLLAAAAAGGELDRRLRPDSRLG